MAGRSPRYRKRKDKNHPELVKELQQVGIIVLDCAAKGFYTDLLIGWRGVWAFVEVKNPDSLTKAQERNRAKSLTDTEATLRDMAKMNDLPFVIATSADEVLRYMEGLTT